MGSALLTLFQPEPDVLLAGVDAIRGLSTHVVDVGAQQAPLAEVDGDVHVQVLQAPHLLGLPHRPWILLYGEEEPLPPGLRMLSLPTPRLMPECQTSCGWSPLEPWGRLAVNGNPSIPSNWWKNQCSGHSQAFPASHWLTSGADGEFWQWLGGGGGGQPGKLSQANDLWGPRLSNMQGAGSLGSA